MSYTIPNVQLIPQDQNNACWYAATQMLIQWRRNNRQMTEMDLRDPSEVPAAVQAYKANNGLAWAQMRRYAQMIGLKPLPLMTPSENGLSQWLMHYGPLWCDGVPVDRNGNVVGTGHVVVISGIRRNQIRIHDPWPPNIGDVSWRPLIHLGGILSDGNNPNRNTFFLRLP